MFSVREKVDQHSSSSSLSPVTTWSPAFSRALDGLLVFTLSSDWLFSVLPFF